MSNNNIVPGFDDGKDESLEILLKKEDNSKNLLLIELSGYIDTFNSIKFQKRIQKAIYAGYYKLVFDCTDLSFISSAGIGSFSVFMEEVRAHGGDIVLYGAKNEVYEVFRLLGFSEIFTFKKNHGESIGFFAKNDINAKNNFPIKIECPVCVIKINISNQGHFRCPDCEAIMSVDAEGNITLG